MRPEEGKESKVFESLLNVRTILCLDLLYSRISWDPLSNHISKYHYLDFTRNWDLQAFWLKNKNQPTTYSCGVSLSEKQLCKSVFSAATAAKSLQSCPTLWDPIDSSPPGSPVPGILQARTLEWVSISFSNAWKWKVKVKSLSCVQLSATPWTTAYQAPPSIAFSRQEYWSGVPLPSPVFSEILTNKSRP